MKKQGTAGLIFSYVFIGLMMLFILVPILYIISVSFSKGGGLYAGSLLPTDFSLTNYRSLFGLGFGRWYLNTIIAGAMTSVITLLLVAPMAYAFSRLRFKGRRKILMLNLILQMFPGMMAMVAYYVVLNMIGLLNTTLGLVLLYAGAAIPGMTWLLKGYLDTVPKALEEAAVIDGANTFQVMTRIIFPLATPMLVLVAVFSFAAPFGDYVLSRIVLTTSDKFTLALGTYSFISGNFQQNYGVFAASSILAGLPICILYLCLQKVIFAGYRGAVTR